MRRCRWQIKPLPQLCRRAVAANENAAGTALASRRVRPLCCRGGSKTGAKCKIKPSDQCEGSNLYPYEKTKKSILTDGLFYFGSGSRSVKKMCRWHIFSGDLGGYAAEGEVKQGQNVK